MRPEPLKGRAAKGSTPVACPTGKRGYPSPKAVRLANSRNGKRLRCYPCPECGHWHVTASQANNRDHR